MITKQLAEEIVELTMVKLNRNLNVMDTKGIILASGEAERIGMIHEGASFVAKTGDVLWITEENLMEWPGTKPGINMPIHFQQQLVGVIGITGNPEELQDFANLVQLTTEIMVHQSLITSRAEWKRKMKELIFEELTWSETISPMIKERLALLGFNAISPFTTLLIESENFISSPHRMIEQLEDQFEREFVLIGHSQSNELFILLSGLDAIKVKKKISKLLAILSTNPSVKIGVGYSVHSLEEIRYSYTTAKSALQFGHEDQRVIYFEDVELLTLLRRNPSTETRRYSKRVLKGLNDSLIDTLAVYFDYNQNTSDSAAALEIHRHTMTYRLRKIKEITGYDPSIFQDAILLKIAILIRE